METKNGQLYLLKCSGSFPPRAQGLSVIAGCCDEILQPKQPKGAEIDLAQSSRLQFITAGKARSQKLKATDWSHHSHSQKQSSDQTYPAQLTLSPLLCNPRSPS